MSSCVRGLSRLVSQAVCALARFELAGIGREQNNLIMRMLAVNTSLGKRERECANVKRESVNVCVCLPPPPPRRRHRRWMI